VCSADRVICNRQSDFELTIFHVSTASDRLEVAGALAAGLEKGMHGVRGLLIARGGREVEVFFGATIWPVTGQKPLFSSRGAH